MPIYAYRCTSCGFEKDHLQKLSDPVLTTCPECGAASYAKQVTAAGFQLKGTGWYATDFKGGSKPAAAKPDDAAKPAAESASESKPASKPDSKTESTSDAKPAAKTETKSETKAAPATPAGGTGGGTS